MEVLDKIKKPNDIKAISSSEYTKLAQEIRDFLIENVSKTGGHLSSNLGTVELTMALHLALSLPDDKIVWDVGHQAYTHKILTGRKDEFKTLRKYGGLSGFPKRRESDSDSFDTGHSSTSISAALGLAKARDLRGTNETIVAVIGDGALTGGMAYEGLNNISQLNTSLIIILNDNNMSISKNVGGVSKYLNQIRIGTNYNEIKGGIEKALLKIPVVGYPIAHTIKRSKDTVKQIVVEEKGMLFEDMGIRYAGPIDGHNIGLLLKNIQIAKELGKPVIIHIVTKKGKGYKRAEKNPSKYHGIDAFDIETGKTLKTKQSLTYTDVFSKKLVSLAEENQKIVAITAAMPSGTGLIEFEKKFPDRFFDVGIAEEHAVTFSAGLAIYGMKPFVAIYSSFLQRAYDQILHDVCIQNLPVVFCIDRSGIVGADGETHQGIFDISYLANIPNMTIIAPKNRYEFSKVLEFASTFNSPLAIKYSRGSVYLGFKDKQTDIEFGKSEILIEDEKSEVAIIAVGSMVEETAKSIEILKQNGINLTFVNARFIKPIDKQMLDYLSTNNKLIVTVEENVKNGGYGQMIADYLFEKQYNIKFLNISIDDVFVEHGSIEILRKILKLDSNSIAERIIKKLKGEDV